MQIGIKEFDKKDLAKIVSREDPQINGNGSLFVKELCVNGGEMYLLTFPYGAIVWRDDKFLYCDNSINNKPTFGGNGKTVKKFDTFCSQCSDSGHYPVGIVLKGIFEVFRLNRLGEAQRKNTITLLKPFDIFGLFEAFADLHGPWYISAGVQSFILSNSIGKTKKLGSLFIGVRLRICM